MDFRVTVRYGRERSRYHLERIRAENLPDALRQLADRLPDEVAAEGDLVEIRPDIDPDAREYVEE
jgi:hypothetical protein